MRVTSCEGSFRLFCFSHEANIEDSDDTIELPDLDKKNSNNEDEEASDRLKLQWDDTREVKTLSHSTDAVANLGMHSNADLFSMQSMKKGYCSSFHLEYHLHKL